MEHVQATLRRFALLTLGGLSLAVLAMPWSVHAGGVHVSVGIGLPVPVVVAPAPVVVAPAPVIVQRPPVVIHQPAPVLVHQAPVVITEPSVVHTHVIHRPHLPPGLAKKVYGRHHGRHRHHHDD